MKVAVIGSRSINDIKIEKYINKMVSEIVSGGAKGVDLCAKRYAIEHGLKYTEFLPEYGRYKKGAPLRRNIEIINYADEVLVFWDGQSKGTKFIIDTCKKIGKSITIIKNSLP